MTAAPEIPLSRAMVTKSESRTLIVLDRRERTRTVENGIARVTAGSTRWYRWSPNPVP